MIWIIGIFWTLHCKMQTSFAKHRWRYEGAVGRIIESDCSFCDRNANHVFGAYGSVSLFEDFRMVLLHWPLWFPQDCTQCHWRSPVFGNWKIWVNCMITFATNVGLNLEKIDRTCPRIVLEGLHPKLLCVAHDVEFIIIELLKNSVAATVNFWRSNTSNPALTSFSFPLKHADDEFPPVIVRISENHEGEAILSISDVGGGISKRKIRRMMRWLDQLDRFC